MANNILEMALERLERDFPPSSLSAWFDDATVVSFTDNRLILHSPVQFKKEFIDQKFIEPLQNALYELTGDQIAVVVVTGEYSTTTIPSSGLSSARATSLRTRRRLRSRSGPRRKTTRCSSTATPAWAKPT